MTALWFKELNKPATANGSNFYGARSIAVNLPVRKIN
jgi:hypothetical protein